MELIYETKKLRVLKLVLDDLNPFYKMQSNPNVMRFVKPTTLSFEENKADLIRLISLYDTPKNDFWIYAIERKSDNEFVGSVALVKDEGDDEIGYRFLEKYWGLGYGSDVVNGLIAYCKKSGFKKLVAYVAVENVASRKIVEGLGFEFTENTFCKDLGIPEKKYCLVL
ncbi:MAG: GNAT family N-acetyltransferase [Flavobacteriaceae bacterium]|nr:MAG: GNAT family N-acetyltransferase [Flavobacteriaceae bacterium]